MVAGAWTHGLLLHCWQHCWWRNCSSHSSQIPDVIALSFGTKDMTTELFRNSPFFQFTSYLTYYLWCSFPSRLKKNQHRIRWGEWIRIKLFSSLIVKWWRKELVSTNYAAPHPPFNCTGSILTLLVTAFIFHLVGRSNSSKHLNHWKRPSVQIIHKIIAQRSQWNKPHNSSISS